MNNKTIQSTVEKYKNIQIAANFNPEKTDVLIGNLFHLLKSHDELFMTIIRL